MKTVYRGIILVIALLFQSFSLVGQTYMYLEQSFKESTTPIPAKRKGLGAIVKFEFGSYKIISGKQGWTKSKTSTNFFGGDAKSESKTKSSFLFTGIVIDTIIANIDFTSVSEVNEQYGFVFRTLTGWSYLEYSKNEVYIADFSSSKDSLGWNLLLAYPVGAEISFKKATELGSNFKGILASSTMKISIVPEFRWENGKRATILKFIEAYTFYLDGKTIAAVQVYPIQKMFVWIKDDLPNDLKDILAVSAATMMVRSDQMRSEID